mmetsp:Transcript_8006/g.23889  ORF Transcript_8006/g.23889 Transcript_8006/m.23889 type:complete len:318 (-) Transcript_8006:20-973(-)
MLTLASVLALASGLRTNTHRPRAAGTVRAAPVAAEAAPALQPPKCPLSAEAQLLEMRNAVIRAVEDGVTRQQVRTLLTRDGVLTPPDETWTGGILQLYGACAPLTRDLLRKVGEARSAAGATPRVSEQRIDASGVDGEALMVAEAESPREDASAFIQPSAENQKQIEAVCDAAGPRLVLSVNPQFRDADDTLDFLAKQTGLLGGLGGFLGGKAAFTSKLDSLGFQDTFSLQEFVVTGTQVRIFRAYPFDWQIFALSDRDDEPAVKLGECPERPDYNVIAEVLEANSIVPKLFRDIGRGKKLVQGVIETTYGDIVASK